MTKYECMGCAVTFTGAESVDKDSNPPCPSCNINTNVWVAQCECIMCCPEGHCDCADCNEPCECQIYEHEFDGTPTSEPCSGADTCPDCLDVKREHERILNGD